MKLNETQIREEIFERFIGLKYTPKDFEVKIYRNTISIFMGEEQKQPIVKTITVISGNKNKNFKILLYWGVKEIELVYASLIIGAVERAIFSAYYKGE